MQQYTVAEALKVDWGGSTYGIYLFRHDKTCKVLYVGYSLDPILRVRQHMHPSSKLRIGIILRECMPDTLSWLVGIYSVAECDMFVRMHKREDYETYLRCQRELSLMDNSARIAEKAMITHYAPLYNFPPGRYNAKRIA